VLQKEGPWPHQKFLRKDGSSPLQLRLRPEKSKFYQATTYIDAGDGRGLRLHQTSLKTSHFSTAEKRAEEWYRKLLRSSDSQPRKLDKTMSVPTMVEVLTSYKTELPKAKRAYAEMKWSTIAPFWRAIEVAAVDTPKLKEFVAWRKRHKTRDNERVKNHTVHKDMILLRQILRYAVEEGQLTQLPLFPKVGKIESNPRPWLTPAEWKNLLAVSEIRIKEAKTKSLRHQREDLHDEIRWFVYSMMRVSDVIQLNLPPTPGLRFQDCRITKNAKGDRVLICEVAGKKHPRCVVTTPGATEIYERRLKTANGNQNALIFPVHRRDAFAELLKDKRANLFTDKYGFKRNFKSLRATSISFAILAGKPKPDLMAIARNAGTSLLMIDTFYAKRLVAEMALDTLSRELPELAGDLKRLPQSVPPDETDDYEKWLRREIENELEEWPNDSPAPPDDFAREADEDEA
jgi:hypothetical protein